MACNDEWYTMGAFGRAKLAFNEFGPLSPPLRCRLKRRICTHANRYVFYTSSSFRNAAVTSQFLHALDVQAQCQQGGAGRGVPTSMIGALPFLHLAFKCSVYSKRFQQSTFLVTSISSLYLNESFTVFLWCTISTTLLYFSLLIVCFCDLITAGFEAFNKS